MKYIYTFIVIAIFSFVIISINPNVGHSNATGAPQGNSGSPFDGATCSQNGCHGGTVTPRASMITSNIPATGYVPGSQYQITAAITQAGVAKFGFQISPQKADGSAAGTMGVADANTQVSSNKYITHSFTGTTGAGGSKTWTFTWTAPAAGSGPVTFYGAFLATNNNGSADAGDNVFTSSLSVGEDGKLNVFTPEQAGLKVYPVPFTNTIYVDKGEQTFENATVKLFTLDGKLVAETVFTGTVTELNTEEVAKGLYILHINAPGVNVVQKVAK